MEVWLVRVIGIICILVGILCGVSLQKVSGAKSKPRKLDGALFINAENSKEIYCQLKNEPGTFTDGQILKLEVMFIPVKMKEET